MSNGGKKADTPGKITQFPNPEDVFDDLRDDEMDQFLRESIKKEADELEERLNQDPRLVGVGASEDLFEKIVEELKKNGDWIEDEEDTTDFEEAEEQAEIDKPEEIDEADNSEKTTDLLIKGNVGTPVQSDRLQDEVLQEDSGELKAENREEIYKLLTDDERKAMEYGYTVRQKQQKKKRRRSRIIRYGSGTAAALAILVGVGMQSEASRKMILKLWDAVVENFDTMIQVDHWDESVTKVDKKEQEAKEEIKNKLGINPIDFLYMPDEMKFSSYEIAEEAAYANMFYTYEDTFFYIYMLNNESEKVAYHQIDGKEKQIESFITEQGIEVSLFNLNRQNKDAYMAEFVRNDTYYICECEVSYEEMKKILNFLIILED